MAFSNQRGGDCRLGEAGAVLLVALEVRKSETAVTESTRWWL